MPGLSTLVVLAFAAYRATRVFTKDTLTDTPRAKLYAWAWANHGDTAVARSSLRAYVYEGLTCPFCLGVWAAAAVFGLWRTGNPTWRGLVVALAVAGGQALLSSRSDA